MALVLRRRREEHERVVARRQAPRVPRDPRVHRIPHDERAGETEHVQARALARQPRATSDGAHDHVGKRHRGIERSVVPRFHSCDADGGFGDAGRVLAAGHEERGVLVEEGVVGLEGGDLAPADATGSQVAGTVQIAVTEIDTNPFQPRRVFSEPEIASLCESLKAHQMIQPVVVRKVGERYQLISGERRLRAATQAGWTHVPANIREADDRLVAEIAIVENLQRQDLNPIEKALSFQRYLDQHDCTQEDLAGRIKINRSTIANLIRLLELPQSVQEGIATGDLSAGHLVARTVALHDDQTPVVRHPACGAPVGLLRLANRHAVAVQGVPRPPLRQRRGRAATAVLVVPSLEGVEEPGGELVCTGSHTVTGDDVDAGGPIVNFATASGTDPNDETVEDDDNAGVPVTLRGTRSILRDGQWLFRRGRISVTVSGAIAPAGDDWNAAIRLRDTARAEILRLVAEPDLSEETWLPPKARGS